MSCDPGYPVPRLRIRVSGSDRLLCAEAVCRIGRDPHADIVVADPRVSWQHAIVEQRAGGWLLHDAASTNGTFRDRQRVGQIAITGTCLVRLGHPDNGPLLICSLA